MIFKRYIFTAIFFASFICAFSQTVTFRDNGKWGVKEKEAELIKPIYDTVFNFDSTGKVCLACFRTRTASANKFMKVMVNSYSCHYLNKKNERLYVKTNTNDTCSIFSLAKNSIKQYNNNSSYFVAGIKGKKYLLTKDFLQLTYKEYQEISVSDDPYYYIVQNMNEGEVMLTGLVNKKEDLIVPFQYSEIKVNPEDSVIIACSASVRPNAEDDVFNYDGKKIEGSRRHIDMATKHFIIHKIFEPKEYYVIYNLKTKEEKQLVADDLKFYEDDEVLIRIKNDWFIYDMLSNQKKPRNKS